MKMTTYPKKSYTSPRCSMLANVSEGLLNASFIEVEKDDDGEFNGDFSAKGITIDDDEFAFVCEWETDW